MIKKKTITQEVEVVEMYCDVCDKQIVYAQQRQCKGCNKIICYDCIGRVVESTGDYNEYWCQSCWEKGEKYRNEIDKLEDKIVDLYDQWQKECMG